MIKKPKKKVKPESKILATIYLDKSLEQLKGNLYHRIDTSQSEVSAEIKRLFNKNEYDISNKLVKLEKLYKATTESDEGYRNGFLMQLAAVKDDQKLLSEYIQRLINITESLTLSVHQIDLKLKTRIATLSDYERELKSYIHYADNRHSRTLTIIAISSIGILGLFILNLFI